MRSKIIVFLIAFSCICCKSQSSSEMHIFYLHGMIIEIQGINAVSEQFGPYRYTTIIDSLKASGAMIHSEVRTTETDFEEFCQKVSKQIDKLVAEGVAPENIGVIGASKGALMTMRISTINKQPVNYVLLGANSDRNENSFDFKLHGRVLGIYEKSDKIAGKKYDYWIERSKDAVDFQQLQINTGLGHGFLYKPIDEWYKPAMEWINGEE